MDFLLATVLFFGIFVGYSAQQAGNLNFACQHEEEYDMCRSPCEPTCNSIRGGIRLICNQSCVAGCFCRDGLVRASDRRCITPEECNESKRPNCKENEEFKECGSPCAVNCSNINDPIFCTRPCHSGCFCKQNFVRDSMGNCVHPRNCYTAGYMQCPVNEHYVNCINICNTCWENSDCRNYYCTPGCDCKPGFYRNFYGQCVTGEECRAPFYDSSFPSLPGYCRENEIYTDCVNLCNDCVSRGRCNYQLYCEPGCDCKPGYFRDERGACVPELFCYQRCNEDQIFSDCGPSCVSTCQNYKRLLYHPCKQQCVPGCFCPRNLVLGPDGRCIKPIYCLEDRPVCPPDEQYYVCIPTCRSTCDTYNDSSAICDTSCTRGCFCKSGLVRRDDGKCVPPRDCPAKNPPCPPGEAFYQCLPTCRTTCESSLKICSTECRPGCFCQPGFVRNSDGKCIRPIQCPSNTTPQSVPFDARDGGTDNTELTDVTTTTSGLSTENNQSVTDLPIQNDAPKESTTLTISAATDPASVATDLAAAPTDRKPNDTCGDACVTTPQTSTNTTLAETTTVKESTTPSGNTLAEVTSLAATVKESTTPSGNTPAEVTNLAATVKESTTPSGYTPVEVTGLAETFKTETNGVATNTEVLTTDPPVVPTVKYRRA